MTKYLSPTSDIVFKKVFASPKNADITIELLNVFLGKKGDERISSITFLESANIADTIKDKITYVDLRCKDVLGNQYIVEMQVVAEAAFFERAQYYHASAIVKQLEKGQKYIELMPVYVIAILDFILFPEYKHYINTFVLKHDATNQVHKGTLGSYTFAELPKFKKEESELSSHLDAWLNMFKRADKERDLPEQFEIYTALTKAYKEIASANFSDAEQMAYQKELDVLRMEKGRLDYALEEGLKKGIEQGIEQGRAQNKLEIAQKMLSKGKSLQEIADILDLEVEFIKQLKK